MNTSDDITLTPEELSEIIETLPAILDNLQTEVANNKNVVQEN